MNDLELRLRDDLRDAAETMPADLDLDVLLHQGRRRRAARTQRRGLAVVAATAVISLVTWVSLAQRTTIGVPDPVATPTVPAVVSSVTFRSQPGEMPQRPYEVITAAESDGVITLTASERETDPPVTLAAVPLNTTVATGTPISSRLSLWTIPGRVDWVDVVTAGETEGAYVDREGHLSSVGVTVVLVISGHNQASKKWIDGVIWRSPDGALRSSAGTTVATATLQFPDVSLTVYRDPGLRQISFFDALDGRGFSSTRDDRPATDVVKTQIALGDPTGWERFAVGILPPGARNARVITSVAGAETVTGTLEPGGAEVFVVRHRSDAEPRGSLVTRVTYTDAQGRTRTYRP